MIRRSFASFILLVSVACARTALAPVAIDTRNDTCQHCRMLISDERLAAEIVVLGETPVLFDDIGCLREYLAQHPVGADGMVYVTDHRTGAWVNADVAVYTQLPASATPMGSGIIAHADPFSRDADALARTGVDAASELAGDAR